MFSLASAINSQLAYHWRSAIYRSPRTCVPWWVSIWITRTPLFFLVSAVIAFSAGLVCFTFASYPHRPFIPVVITVATSISSFALLAVGFWFAGERYAFSKTEGTKVRVMIINPLWPSSLMPILEHSVAGPSSGRGHSILLGSIRSFLAGKTFPIWPLCSRWRMDRETLSSREGENPTQPIFLQTFVDQDLHYRILPREWPRVRERDADGGRARVP